MAQKGNRKAVGTFREPIVWNYLLDKTYFNTILFPKDTIFNHSKAKDYMLYV